MKATKFIIDRSKWARGGEAHTFLLNSSNRRMCCLGFYALACGVTKHDIQERSAYYDLMYPASREIPSELAPHGGLHDRLVNANDNGEIPGHVREERITELFASIGVGVEFVDGNAQ